MRDKCERGPPAHQVGRRFPPTLPTLPFLSSCRTAWSNKSRPSRRRPLQAPSTLISHPSSSASSPPNASNARVHPSSTASLLPTTNQTPELYSTRSKLKRQQTRNHPPFVESSPSSPLPLGSIFPLFAFQKGSRFNSLATHTTKKARLIPHNSRKTSDTHPQGKAK